MDKYCVGVSGTLFVFLMTSQVAFDLSTHYDTIMQASEELNYDPTWASRQVLQSHICMISHAEFTSYIHRRS